jgi:hypothetical protein
MSIEQKIAELLAESKKAKLAEQVEAEEIIVEEEVEIEEEANNGAPSSPNPSNAKNNVQDEKEAEGGTSKKPNTVTKNASAPEASNLKGGMKEDIDALVNGEDLSEEFKEKAATIFEAAVLSRVNTEVARLEEEFEAKLQEAAAKNQEGLVEQVDGYLNYVVEQWMAQNEIALDRGMKSEIQESFISGMKSLFEEHYIDVPEEKYDVLGSLEEQVDQLESKLNEQVATNIELSKAISELKRVDIIKAVSEGLTDTESEKFAGLAEELSYEDEVTFKSKVQTIRENYFTTKANADVKSVVTDTPVDMLTEDAPPVDPSVRKYLSVFDNLKK